MQTSEAIPDPRFVSTEELPVGDTHMDLPEVSFHARDDGLPRHARHTPCHRSHSDEIDIIGVCLDQRASGTLLVAAISLISHSFLLIFSRSPDKIGGRNLFPQFFDLFLPCLDFFGIAPKVGDHWLRFIPAVDALEVFGVQPL